MERTPPHMGRRTIFRRRIPRWWHGRGSNNAGNEWIGIFPERKVFRFGWNCMGNLSFVRLGFFVWLQCIHRQPSLCRAHCASAVCRMFAFNYYYYFGSFGAEQSQPEEGDANKRQSDKAKNEKRKTKMSIPKADLMLCTNRNNLNTTTETGRPNRRRDKVNIKENRIRDYLTWEIYSKRSPSPRRSSSLLLSAMRAVGKINTAMDWVTQQKEARKNRNWAEKCVLVGRERGRNRIACCRSSLLNWLNILCPMPLYWMYLHAFSFSIWFIRPRRRRAHNNNNEA